jgi:phosphoribosylformylglycinamidine synthase
MESIAGICNESGNILGMMPHPERSCQNELEIVGLTSKAMRIFDSLMNFLKK